MPLRIATALDLAARACRARDTMDAAIVATTTTTTTGTGTTGGAGCDGETV